MTVNRGSSFLVIDRKEASEWLEDDLIARTGYFQTMKNVALQQTSVEWMVIEFSQLGFIGKMFKASDLPVLVEFILMFYKDKPIDWLLDHMLWVKVCHPEKDADNDFGKQILHRANQNPSADITMSLTAYQHFSIEKAYYGQGFFWALTPVSGDHITISFHQPVTVKRYLFRSGNIEHPGDKLFNTSVEVQPANKLVLEKMKEGLLSTYEQTKDGYIRIGAFVNGVAEGEVPPVDKITAIRLFIHSNSPVWVLLSEVTYKTPVPTGKVNFAETFDDGSLDGWKISKTMKDDTDDEIAKYDGKWEVEPLKENTVPGDKGLVLKSRAKHHAIAAMLQEPFVFEEQPLVVQYEVNFQDGIDCGGAYMKLLSATDDLDLENFYDRTPYTIMFGPDKCGEDYKLHFIFRHKNPKNGDYEEKQAKRPDVDLKKIFSDKKTHLYTLEAGSSLISTLKFLGVKKELGSDESSVLSFVVNFCGVLSPDNSFEIFIDQTSVSKGNLLEDFVPPINPAKEIDDPNDSKPEDWDEHPKIPNPEETKPDDWDEEMDGEWEAPQVPNPACETAPGCGTWKLPMINNPNYKGKWKPSMIDNPNYQGIWSPRKIPNPDYFEDLHPFRMTPFSAVGLELWSMTSDIYFDNFIICSEKEVADRWAADSWGLKKLVASANEPSVLSQLTTAAEERPWLWIVYILTVGLPLGLVVLFCFPKVKKDAVLSDLE
ncbi:UNVERIFIED_CONTAM: hypothetical protein FKN15_015290 [Acipenser sinensis]